MEYLIADHLQTMDKKGADFILPGSDNSFVVIIYVLGSFIVTGTNKSARRVAPKHQWCLLLCISREYFLVEDSGHLWDKLTNKSL